MKQLSGIGWTTVTFLFFFLIGALFIGGSAADAQTVNLYIAQSVQGAGDGSSCSNAKTYPFFNTSSNWGTAVGQIGPGTVHLCGTISSSLTVQSSGSNASRIS